MNIGSIKQNEAGIFIGRVSTLTVSVTVALREVRSNNPRAPRYEIHASWDSDASSCAGLSRS